jgi:hypothetical protein
VPPRKLEHEDTVEEDRRDAVRADGAFKETGEARGDGAPTTARGRQVDARPRFPRSFFLDFLGLKDTFAEKDIEAAILREIEAFILELGNGFCFIARQKRMQIDARDYHLDLLFYHRKLRRLVAIDLKLGDFEAADKGQMELYLSWLKRHECEPEEAEPLGLILCAGKSEEHVELLELARSGIHVASYWTKVLPKKQLERKLHDAVRLARARLENRVI